MSRELLHNIIGDFSPDKFSTFFREKNRLFAPRQEALLHYNDEDFTKGLKLGEINYLGTEKITICAFMASHALSERTGKKAQYDKGKKILRDTQSAAGIFIFYDKSGNFRFSLIYPETIGNRRQWSNFRRFTYFVSTDPSITNKTFLQRISQGDFSALEKVKEAFALGPVTEIFYKDFFVEYNKLVQAIKKRNRLSDQKKARDFVLLFTIRTIFLGFIQKRGWIGRDEKFIQNFLREYEEKHSGKDIFYKKWLTPLFFQALNSPPGRKAAYGDNEFSAETEKNLQMAPYLNGGLFREKPDYDDQGYFVPDKEIKDFFEFLFSYNFTIEENSYEDEDLQLNPEFLGIIFERLVNKADGAVYTPRTEVDLMCRLSLTKWLEKNINLPVNKTNLYELFFREGEKKEDQKQGSFSQSEVKDILNLLEHVTICDPAVGSGAFLVGMMQVLDEIEQSLKTRVGLQDADAFERKKRIIAQSLYGVEVKEWAVWICQLRLWLSLFIEAPDKIKNSFEAILPSLEFKVRQGDSLVQRVGSKSFPVLGHALIGESVKRKVTELKKLKNEYFGNKTPMKEWEIRQRELSIYEQILQSDIAEKQKEVRRLKNVKSGVQASLFGDEFFKPAQKELDFDKEKVELLEIEINELIEQKRNIRKDKPLIWNIEFAEIFVDSGGFDIIIGNPPYVMYKDIRDPSNIIKNPTEYKNQLKEMVRIDFPNYFRKNSEIDGKSDLYTYFYIRALRLLNQKGVHVFICSNAWLDVGYGIWLQNFLLNCAPIEFIIDNYAKRSFEAADVNTLISIIHAPQKKVDQGCIVKFVAFKKPFEETVFTEYLLQIEAATDIVSNSIMRVYPISVQNLKEAGTEYENDTQKKMKLGRYIGDKWGGVYLRSPELYLEIISRNKNKLIKISNDNALQLLTGVKEGGYSDYIKDKTTILKKDSKQYIPIIKNVKKHKSLIIKEADSYIVKKIQHFKKTSKNKKADLLWLSGRGWTHKRQKNENQNIFSGNYIGINVLEKEFINDYLLLLNSTLMVFFSEIVNRGKGIGGGACVFTKTDLLSLYIPKKNLLNIKDLDHLLNSISRRELKTIFEECGIDPESETPIEKQEPKPLRDRAELDAIIFDVLGLTKDERQDVYRETCRLVWNRISKAKSV